jgi:hypothetical protein
LGDLGAPGKVFAEEAGSRRGLEILRICDLHVADPQKSLRSILAKAGPEWDLSYGFKIEIKKDRSYVPELKSSETVSYGSKLKSSRT